MQPTQLYLDTARLGQMSQRAQRMLFDFTRLAGEEGGSLLFERFLQNGSDFWSAAFRTRFPSLAHWHGVASLKEDLRALAGSDPHLPVLMVNRSTQLMKFAARLLFQRCQNVAVTDLCWPRYREILERESLLSGRSLTTIQLRSLVSEIGITEGDVIESARTQCRESHADGLFLTSVSHFGVRLPTERLVNALESERDYWAVVVDGAQDFCHASADLSHEYCDLYMAGCHKWLQGFHPMGLGYYGRKRSCDTIQVLLDYLLEIGELDDPLLRFTAQLESAKLDGDTETVNLISLFTCQGAATDALEQPTSIESAFQVRRKNLVQAAEIASESGWKTLMPPESFRTGILLLQAERSETRQRCSRELRQSFAERGVALTAYDEGQIRLSMPASPWQSSQMDILKGALQAVA